MVKENLTPQPEEPGIRIGPPSLANLSNQADSQLQPLNPHKEQSAPASLVGNEVMQLDAVEKNEDKSLVGNEVMQLDAVEKNKLELTTLLEFRQNFELAISQRNKYSAAAAIVAKIASPQTNSPAVLSAQPELRRVEPNNFGPAEHERDAVLPTRKIAAIETSPTTPNPSQHQAPARLQTELSFHPRSIANRVQENRFDRKQTDLPKNLDGSDRLPWDTNKRGVFDQAFENHMARSLMQYPAYRELMAGELITKVRKHISAGRYDLKRRDELLIEWEAMQNPAHNDFSTESHTLTAKGAARRAKIARALNMKDFS